ncbi:MAG: phosphodiester glycosidase family protein [Deltaproteobacteria bacterium]
MKQNNKRITSLLLTVIFIISSFVQPIFSFSFAQGELIYEERDSEIISSGVTRENIKKFLTSGWLNINVITVDLTNPYVKLDLLTSPDGIGTLENVKTMAEASKSVAAINADFFDKTPTSSNPSAGYPIGFTMKSGNNVSSAHYLKNTMATFSMDNLKNFLYSYVTDTMSITSASGSKINVADINKPSPDYKYPIIYNKYWGKYSVGSNSKFSDFVEMVVSDNVVTEIRLGMPPVEIPENGFVLAARFDVAKSITSSFQVGDSVTLAVTTTPDLSSQDFAIGGGTLLLKNGQVPAFSHKISGIHPRTAAGTSVDNRYLYLVTVDGRQTISAGVTMEEMAAIMQDIGCYNAINFDGGGSTQMVERLPGTNTLKIVNYPCEIPLRKVVDALGVFSTAPQGSLKGFIIETSDTNVFVNTTREFKIKGYDEYYNPVEVDQNSVVWNISGVKGYFSGNILTPTQAGEATITASVSGITESIPVSILSSPVEIAISPRDTTTSVGKKVKFTLTGKNKNGYSAIIDPAFLAWKSSQEIGVFSKNEFTVSSQGSTIISCSLGNATAFARITAAGSSEYIVQPCEESVISYKSYPLDIPGEASLSNEQQHTGSYSYKLTYDFSTLDGSRASYIVFPENSITMGSNTTDFGLWVYNDSPKNDWLKGQIVDSQGAAHLIDLSKDLSWTGWKFIKIPVDNIPLPAQISRVYVVQIDSEIKSSGSIYVDDLTLFTQKSGDSLPAIPENIKVPDSAEKAVKVKSSASSFQFIITGGIQTDKTILDRLYSKKLKEKINTSELIAATGTVDTTISQAIKKPIVSALKGPSTYTYKNSTFITLDDTKNSIRQTNASQWKWLDNTLANITSKNVFIMFPVSVDNFSDPYEAELFKKIITKYKKASGNNVWVISGGKISEVEMEKGLRNVTCAGMIKSSDITTVLDKTKYIIVSVVGSEVTYQIKNVF